MRMQMNILVHLGGQGHDGEVDVVRVPDHVLLASGRGVTEECVGRALGFLDGARLAAVQLIEVAVHRDKADKVIVNLSIMPKLAYYVQYN